MGLPKGLSEFWKINRWQDIKPFFSSGFIRFATFWTAAVPLAIKALKPLPETIAFRLGTEKVYEVSISLPFSWWVLWISAILYILALLIYVFGCPQFIKKYGSYHDFKIEEHSPRWIPWQSGELIKRKFELDKFFNRMIDKGYFLISSEVFETGDLPKVEVKQGQSVVYASYNGAVYEFGLPVFKVNSAEVDQEKNNIIVKDVFWEIFGRFAASHPFWQKTAKVFLVFAILMFSYVVLQNIIFVIRFLVDGL